MGRGGVDGEGVDGEGGVGLRLVDTATFGGVSHMLVPRMVANAPLLLDPRPRQTGDVSPASKSEANSDLGTQTKVSKAHEFQTERVSSKAVS